MNSFVKVWVKETEGNYELVSKESLSSMSFFAVTPCVIQSYIFRNNFIYEIFWRSALDIKWKIKSYTLIRHTQKKKPLFNFITLMS